MNIIRISYCIFMLVHSSKLQRYGCSDNWILADTNDTCYFFSEGSEKWQEAKHSCIEMSSHLVILNNFHSQNGIENAMQEEGKTGDWYIGLSYVHQNGFTWKWQWVDSLKLSKTQFWGENQPVTKLYMIFDKCVAIRMDETIARGWFNMDCDGKHKFVCEKQPVIMPTVTVEPSTSVSGNTVADESTQSDVITAGDQTITLEHLAVTTVKQPPITTPYLHTTDKTSSAFAKSRTTNTVTTGKSSYKSLVTALKSTPPYTTTTESQSSHLAKKRCSYETHRINGAIHLNVPHGGKIYITCKNGYQISQNPSTCDDGKWLPSYPTCRDVDECERQASEIICDRNAVCINTVGSFECVCKAGFVRESKIGFCISDFPTTGSSNKPSHGGEVCDSEEDAILGIEWEETPAEEFTDWLQCQNSDGVMRRYCDEHGAWAVPDTTYCVGEDMSELQKSLNESTLNDTSKSADILQQLGDTLQSDETLTGADILIARDILATIARNKYFYRDDSMIHELLPLIKQFLLACSNSLDLRVEEQWGQTYRNLGSDGSAVSILSAMEEFGATVYLYMVNTGKDLFLQSKNIDLLGYFVNRGSGQANKRKKRTLLGNDTMSIHESVTFSRQFFDQFQAKETDLPVALVMFVYRTTGNILPADIKQNQAKRTWVKSVTTTRIIKKVNTVALAVSAHPKLENALYNLTNMAVVRLYEIQEGYNPRCSFADVGQHTGIWDVSVCRLLRQGFDDYGEYVDCVCDQIGTFCAIMSLGEQPKPFLETAIKPLMAVYSGISALLILTALIMISFSRLPSDRYFVLGQAILSLASFPIIICTASALEFMDSEQPIVCQGLAVAMNYSLISSCCWIMNMSIQQLRRLMFIDRMILARILYVLIGWLLPLVAVVSLYVNRLPDHENIVSCWLDASTYALAISITVEVLIMMITLVIICYAYNIFTKYGQKCGQDESERLWEDVFSVMLLYGTILFVRVTGYSTTLAKSLDGSYFFTLMIFSEGSVIFLRFFAINREVLVALRIRICGDKDERDALAEVQVNETEILTKRREVLKQTRKREREISKRQQEKDEKSKKIQHLFHAAQRTHRVHVK